MRRTLQPLMMLLAVALLAALTVPPLDRSEAKTAAPQVERSAGVAMRTRQAAAQDQPGTGAGAKKPASSTATTADATAKPAASKQPPASPESIILDQCVQVAHDIDPELGEQLANKRAKNPAEFEQQMQEDQVGRRLWAMVQLQQRDPDLYQLKISEITQSLQINRVAAQLQQAMLADDAGTVKTLKEQLRNLLQIQFAMSLKARAEYLCRIEEQVKNLREEIDHDAANFHQIIEARMRQLLEQPVPTDPAAVIPADNRAPRGNRANQPRRP